jgi:hypothetical protein
VPPALAHRSSTRTIQPRSQLPRYVHQSTRFLRHPWSTRFLRHPWSHERDAARGGPAFRRHPGFADSARSPRDDLPRTRASDTDRRSTSGRDNPVGRRRTPRSTTGRSAQRWKRWCPRRWGDRQKLGRNPASCDERVVGNPALGLRPKARGADSGLHSFGAARIVYHSRPDAKFLVSPPPHRIGRLSGASIARTATDLRARGSSIHFRAGSRSPTGRSSTTRMSCGLCAMAMTHCSFGGRHRGCYEKAGNAWRRFQRAMCRRCADE